jgi:gamma-glutamyltranspeptidase/glutathione hydrolase
MEIPQHRGVVMAPNGMVATGHPLASAAGAQALCDGGNAIDAAFTAAAVLGVVQPMMSGLGGDSFLLFHDRSGRRTWAINGSGPAPRALSLDYLREHTGGTLPGRGVLSAGVPGSVDVMCTALERWGRLDLGRVLAPAIRYAEDGAPIAESVAAIWALEQPTLAQFPSSASTLLRDGRACRVGERLRMPEYAATLRRIAAGGRDAFYTGEPAERIAAYCRAHGGLLDEADLAAYRCEVGAPIETTYRDCTVQTTAPPSQGAILLEELNLVETFDLQSLPWGGPDAVHLMAEAKKLAFADRNAYLGDPSFRANPLSALLSKEYARKRREAIRLDSALRHAEPGALPEHSGDTTYLCAADRDGNLVSLITSLSAAFGCGEVIEGTGMLLNNRVGRGFSTDPASPNVLAPGKRTMHTLLPYLVLRGEEPLLAGGTPGGDAQPQINLQVITNILEWGMNVQQAIEAPRWASFPGTDPASLASPFELRLEPGFPRETVAELERRGHTVVAGGPFTWFGAQVIRVDAGAGCYHGGSDPRVDGCAIGH